ncbi:hypothetical protein KIH27_06765 [Mycobacterium sp. M1]|uniref:HTH cro/C1-type domain-containing protein n=1 Tax=Mycolicibacter acidiphilus TaxID=2835306 RepID=A0ABS5RG70_9MYCO|nr:hypothetical protein [Mycolicibacter acidiphilus]MBS9533290.1 hypothetical protein [Mycolicibacter acidiphilus]
MTTTALVDLLERVNDATGRLRRSTTVPAEVGELIDSFDSIAVQEVDPHLASALWEAAFSASKALRQEDADRRRREVRVALEQFRHALRDIVDDRPCDDGAPIRDVLARTAEVLSAPQKTLADLLGVSVRQLQRWLADDGPQPAAGDAARIRVVANLVNQLRHTFTGPGVVAWFERKHPVLRRRPIDLLDDPLNYPRLLGAANAARTMTA